MVVADVAAVVAEVLGVAVVAVVDAFADALAAEVADVEFDAVVLVASDVFVATDVLVAASGDSSAPMTSGASSGLAGDGVSDSLNPGSCSTTEVAVVGGVGSSALVESPVSCDAVTPIKAPMASAATASAPIRTYVEPAHERASSP